MKALVISATSVVLLAVGPAIAADFPLKARTAPEAVYTWTGFYLGIQSGYLWGDARHTFDNGAPSDTSNLKGFVSGLHAGYNVQNGSFVFGVEVDAEGSTAKGDFQNTTGITSEGSADLVVQGSVRGRLGFTTGPALLYVTGGWAYGQFRFGGGPFDAKHGPCCGFSDNMSGWTAGGGLQYAISNSVSARVEYRYTDYGSTSGGLAPTFPGVTMGADVTTHAIRSGFSVKLN
jgi:outer membrane immunogenic protein